ncbi:hypothetical protein OFN54_27495, partial [Escherichia coli]|nr:hypothetical protein [Escherichia coli]
IAIVILENMMEIMVTLSKCEKGEYTIIASSVFVCESLLTPNMCEGVNEKSRMVTHKESSRTNDQ